jgi:hypothetical protein
MRAHGRWSCKGSGAASRENSTLGEPRVMRGGQDPPPDSPPDRPTLGSADGQMEEREMTTSICMGNGTAYGRDAMMEAVKSYMNDGTEYDYNAVLVAWGHEINSRLPEGVSYHPGTNECLIEDATPDFDFEAIWDDAWEALEARITSGEFEPEAR